MANHQRIAVCLSWRYAEDLTASGEDAMSLSRFLRRIERGDPLTAFMPVLTSDSTVVVHDGACMDIESVRRLMTYVESANAKVEFRGDIGPNPSVGNELIQLVDAWRRREKLRHPGERPDSPRRRM